MYLVRTRVLHDDWLFIRKIIELEEELKVVTNNMKSLEIAEQEVILHMSSFSYSENSFDIVGFFCVKRTFESSDSSFDISRLHVRTFAGIVFIIQCSDLISGKLLKISYVLRAI